MQVMVLGASGMIGSAVSELLNRSSKYKVMSFGRRRVNQLPGFPDTIDYSNICDLSCDNVVSELFISYKPDVVINCAGITKHLNNKCSLESMIAMNALLPHRLSRQCTNNNARLIHISTDCVFSGEKGGYIETDVCDANDVYGRSKARGEIKNNEHITLRTSTIGHEYLTKFGLLEWFLSQKESCEGYKKAIFSGLTSLALADVIINYVLPNNRLRGLYHVGGMPIDKSTLLKYLAKIYNHSITIYENTSFVIDRSLNSNKFYHDTGYVPESWETQITKMKNYKDGDTFV